MGKVVQFRKPSNRFQKGPSNFSLTAIGLTLGAAIGGVIVVGPSLIASRDEQGRTYRAEFSLCHVGGGMNCVVDGDTFWVNSEKVRVMDIDAPETHPSRCAFEADLGNRATARLMELLNAGGFQMKAGERDQDQYGRKLRIVLRDGNSIGLMLVNEGLARRWTGSRHPWC